MNEQQTSLFDDRYPYFPGARKTDTSQEAARDIAPKADFLREKVLIALKLRPMSADDCAAELGEDKLSIRPRFSELSKLGRIEDTGRRTLNKSGKKAIVWGLK